MAACFLCSWTALQSSARFNVNSSCLRLAAADVKMPFSPFKAAFNLMVTDPYLNKAGVWGSMLYRKHAGEEMEPVRWTYNIQTSFNQLLPHVFPQSNVKRSFCSAGPLAHLHPKAMGSSKELKGVRGTGQWVMCWALIPFEEPPDISSCSLTQWPFPFYCPMPPALPSPLPGILADRVTHAARDKRTVWD